MSAGPFPVRPDSAGELVQSLTYREAYAPASSVYDRPVRRGPTQSAPQLLRTAAGGAWALVSIAAAGAALLVLVLLVVRVAGVLA